ncbi:MAG: ATP-binding protein [Pirellulaceae bacterium]
MTLTFQEIATQHLQLKLHRIHRVLSTAVAAQTTIARELKRPDVTPYCVSDEQVAQLIQHTGNQLCYLPSRDVQHLPTSDEEWLQEELRTAATRMGKSLPLDTLVAELGLNDFEVDVVLVCLATEMHRSYSRIIAYIHDELNSKLPSIGLLCSLFSRSETEWLQYRRLLSGHGNLRRLGLILTHGLAQPEQHLACQLAPGILDGMLGIDGNSNWRDWFSDPEEVSTHDASLELFAERHQLKAAANAIRIGDLDVLGLWGDSAMGVESAVLAVGAECGKQLRRLTISAETIRPALIRASFLNAIVWIDVGLLLENENPQLADQILVHLQASRVPIVLSGQNPWRPTSLLAKRDYAEIQLSIPDADQRLQNWNLLIPGLPRDRAQAMSNRFQLAPEAMIAVKRAENIQWQLARNVLKKSERFEGLDEVCRFVLQAKVCKFAKPVTPQRGPQDLVLPPPLHEQVLEVASFYQSLSKVNEKWGFGRLQTGAGGIKALFAGDSGTGKTLAAEVIAKQVGVPMLQIDLSQLVSKWIGETEKNIDAAFDEAEASHAMLFFDEADTLFGKRGEIQRGSDRYANLEVGFLLQRLESFPGLVVLASNLKDDIDSAFIRRFQVVLHFPRPQARERLRLWQIAIPPSAPLDPSIDLSSLVHIDLTGAGIFNACHTAALLAAQENSDMIRHAHIVEGIARQFHRESRVISTADLNQFCQTNPALVN